MLGALTGLLIVTGQAPYPFDPVFLHFLLHGGDFHSITKSIMKEWHPTMAGRICKFLEAGHEGNIEPFRHEFAILLDSLDVRRSMDFLESSPT